jgi:hypothetical protein
MPVVTEYGNSRKECSSSLKASLPQVDESKQERKQKAEAKDLYR